MANTARAIRATAWAAVALGVAAPIVQRKLRLRPATAIVPAAVAPVALSVVRRRTRLRDIATCCMQMWAYIAMYEMPSSDPDKIERRVHIDYPIKVDRLLGLGGLPSVRLQRWLGRSGSLTRFDRLMVWTYWLWAFFPHTSVLYILLRHRERFARSASIMYATFDVGSLIYWLVPTAPPWYAHQLGRFAGEGEQSVRRLMFEYGPRFWGDQRWERMHNSLEVNQLAAMPSLHCATSVQAARLLSDCGPIEGALGWSYALTLCFALVYLGEHYLIDLLVGVGLSETVQRNADRVEPAFRSFSAGVRALEAKAHSG